MNLCIVEGFVAEWHIYVGFLYWGCKSTVVNPRIFNEGVYSSRSCSLWWVVGTGLFIVIMTMYIVCNLTYIVVLNQAASLDTGWDRR